MNLAWVVPRSGTAHAQNLHAKDRVRLEREGFVPFRLEWVTDGNSTRHADVYAQRTPTTEEVVAGANALYAARGRGTVRLLDQFGRVVIT